MAKRLYLNNRQLNYIMKLLEADEKYMIDQIENTDCDTYVIDFLQFEMETNDQIVEKLRNGKSS